jgi:hypothetical protein
MKMLKEIRTQVARWAQYGWFPTFWSFIGLVAALDIYLIERFRGVLAHLEENPVGLFLIKLNGGDVGVFIRVKAAGTVVVMSALLGLYIYRRRWSFPVTASVAAFQCGLLAYVILTQPPRRATHHPPNAATGAAACIEAVRDGISSVLSDFNQRPLAVQPLHLQGQASPSSKSALVAH